MAIKLQVHKTMWSWQLLNLLKPTGHVMQQQV